MILCEDVGTQRRRDGRVRLAQHGTSVYWVQCSCSIVGLIFACVFSYCLATT